MTLFGSKKKKAPGYSYFAAGVTLEGRVCFNGIIRLDGRVNGEVISTGTLVIEETAVITGSVMGENIIMSGTVYGNIQASKQLHLNPMAKVYGQINYSDLSIEGALHEGRSHKLTQYEAEQLHDQCLAIVEEAAANVEKIGQMTSCGLDKNETGLPNPAAVSPPPATPRSQPFASSPSLTQSQPLASPPSLTQSSVLAQGTAASPPRHGRHIKNHHHQAEIKSAGEAAPRTMRAPESVPATKPSETTTILITDALTMDVTSNGNGKKTTTPSAGVVKAAPGAV